jgi:hypothetical protein
MSGMGEDLGTYAVDWRVDTAQRQAYTPAQLAAYTAARDAQKETEAEQVIHSGSAPYLERHGMGRLGWSVVIGGVALTGMIGYTLTMTHGDTGIDRGNLPGAVHSAVPSSSPSPSGHNQRPHRSPSAYPSYSVTSLAPLPELTPLPTVPTTDPTLTFDTTPSPDDQPTGVPTDGTLAIIPSYPHEPVHHDQHYHAYTNETHHHHHHNHKEAAR